MSRRHVAVGLMYGIGIGMFANHIIGWLEQIVMHAPAKKRGA